MQKQYVRRLFDSIAYRYDLLNHLLSGGIDLYWRRTAIATLSPYKPQKILDVATGTADFAIAALHANPDTVVGVDISEAMLEVGRRKVLSKGLSDRITLEAGEAEHLHYPDNAFDAAIVAFGARNFENLEEGLSEMRRVVRKGGCAMVLEFSRPRVFPFKQLYFFYFQKILPRVGRVISRDKEAYTYLPDTVIQFPDGEAFAAILRKVGFTSVTAKRLTFGITTVYSAEK